LVGREKHVLRGIVLTFLITVPPKFISLLENKDPQTLVIVAHYFGMIAFVDELLWLRGVAGREIMGILTVLPFHWRWAMEWPLQQIQRDDLELSLPSTPNN
jgi:predicted alpha/beta hydrolase family esterase